jgi:hypothetical protein
MEQAITSGARKGAETILKPGGFAEGISWGGYPGRIMRNTSRFVPYFIRG